MHNNVLRVGIYLRLSDEDKKYRFYNESESIKNQRNMLLEEISKRKNFILVDEYCDEDLSGAGTFRPEFERLIKDCENDKIDVVLCKSQSRFSRDMEIIEKYIHNKFIEWNVRFIGLVDNADTNLPGNKKARQINGLVNEWYLEDTSNNIKSAFLTKMKHGEFISPFAAYGYKVSKDNNNKLEIDDEAANIVKRIFTMYLNGISFTGIAKYLNEHNFPSPSFYKYQKGIKLNIVSKKPRNEIKWSANSIKTILTNELYMGNLVQGKRTTVSYKNHKIIKKDAKEWIRIENTHEPIIDKSIFKRTQILLKERKRPLKKYDNVHVFSGKVFCLKCNSYMRKKNSISHEYLVCSNTNFGECNNKQSIRYDVLEKIILNSLNTIINKYYDEKFLVDIVKKEKEKYFVNKIELLEHRKFDILNKLLNNKKYLKLLYEDKINNLISKKHFHELIEDYDYNIKILEEQLECTSNKIKKYNSPIFYKKWKENIIFKYKNFKKLNNIIVDEFIDKIYISDIDKMTNSRNIFIEWKL